MSIRFLGAILIIAVCGGFGFRLAAAHRTDLLYLRNLVSVLDYMECELNYRLTPLPKLCRQAAGEHPKTIGPFFMQLADTLDSQICADVSVCVAAVLENFPAPASWKRKNRRACVCWVALLAVMIWMGR